MVVWVEVIWRTLGTEPGCSTPELHPGQFYFLLGSRVWLSCGGWPRPCRPPAWGAGRWDDRRVPRCRDGQGVLNLLTLCRSPSSTGLPASLGHRGERSQVRASPRGERTDRSSAGDGVAVKSPAHLASSSREVCFEVLLAAECRGSFPEHKRTRAADSLVQPRLGLAVLLKCFYLLPFFSAMNTS